MGNQEERIRELIEKMKNIEERPATQDHLNWKLPNESKETTIKGWSDGIEKFAEENKHLFNL